ncbi:pur operon repressor [Jeotgalibaca sp. MA1X17-3]|uniref:pur operon repressor n=1 Tax=Jeotgalibaca sp. MA1X17-3 TaxID=2908211 RepID=UPI001F355888|nr:pur operon repressor [Jeotgalibaca sp. MA1X17-3]UJF16198.1 pur operon repressor [Jeotgalibaca sp. MA1X17-3]
MKIKRSERLVDMTHHLLEHPHTLVSLTYYSKKYGSAKSSISEDLSIIKRTFEENGIGIVETLPGAAGGVKYTPTISDSAAKVFIEEICEMMASKERLLPGGYVYLSDLLGNPQILQKIGRIIASQYTEQSVTAVMTVATKGVPIAQAVASNLNVPFVIVRRDSKITEGSTVSINYVSGSSERVEKMELSKRSLPSGSKVLIVDDFMKGGGTVNGMKSMIEEFDSETVGVMVFAEAAYTTGKETDDYTSLIRVDKVDLRNRTMEVSLGSHFD